MAADLHSPRPDIIFMRRRLKKGETATPQAATMSARTGLNLSRPPKGDSVQLPSESPIEPRKDSTLTSANVPMVTGLSLLTNVNDAYRLNKRQSAIGSLVISDVLLAGWQLTDGSSGYLYNQNTPPFEDEQLLPREFKKRPLIEFQKGNLIVGLRNVKHLKRLIIVPKEGTTMQAVTMTGVGVAMPYEPFTVLYISVVGNQIEFRKDDFRNKVSSTYNLHTVRPNQPERIALKPIR